MQSTQYILAFVISRSSNSGSDTGSIAGVLKEKDTLSKSSECLSDFNLTDLSVKCGKVYDGISWHLGPHTFFIFFLVFWVFLFFFWLFAFQDPL